MIPRRLERVLEDQHFAEDAPRMAFVTGPRQCGKTTLARAMQERRGTPDLYRNWDDLRWRSEIARTPYGFVEGLRPSGRSRPLAVLDEIHKFPRWKTYLKGLFDTHGDAFDLLVTGSGRLDVFRRGGDSLLGRYHLYRMHPLTLSEVLGVAFDPDRDTPDAIRRRVLGEADPPDRRAVEAFDGLLRFGGFPRPFVAQKERAHRVWIRERRERLIREDLRDLTRIQLLSSVEQMVELLLPRVGTLLSLSNLREDLDSSLDSVRLWMTHLERLYFCFRLRPYAGKVSRALAREPKIYFQDWSEVPVEGARFENLVAAALLSWCHFSQDLGQEPLDLRFIRDKEKREVDFLLTKGGRPFLLIETKTGDPQVPGPLFRFSNLLGGVPAVLVVARLDRPGKASGIPVLPAATFLRMIP